MVRLNIPDDAIRQQVVHRHASPEEEPDLGGRDVVVDHLPYDENVLPPRAQVLERFVDIRACSLDNKGAEAAKDDVKLQKSRIVSGRQYRHR